jgi:hypothetical protein
MHIVYLEHAHPLHYNSILPFPHFSNSAWWVSLCCLHMYIWVYFRLLCHSVSFPFPAPCTGPPSRIVPHIHSYPIIIISLGLCSTNEWEHEIFGLLSIAYITQHDDLQFHPFSYKWHNFIFLYGWVKCVYILYHIFFIHSPDVGHLHCFHSLALVQISLLIYTPLIYAQ